MTLHNAPASHDQIVAVALILDLIVMFGFVMTVLAIHAHRCDKAEEDA